MGAPGHPKGEVEPDVLLSRCSGKSLCDLSRLQSGEKTLTSTTPMGAQEHPDVVEEATGIIP